jgi:hypothetical protein
VYRWFGQSQEEAQEDVDDARKELARLRHITFDEALTEYRTFLVETGHKRPSTKASADETIRRLRLFFEGVMQMRISRLNRGVRRASLSHVRWAYLHRRTKRVATT